MSSGSIHRPHVEEAAVPAEERKSRWINKDMHSFIPVQAIWIGVFSFKLIGFQIYMMCLIIVDSLNFTHEFFCTTINLTCS